MTSNTDTAAMNPTNEPTSELELRCTKCKLLKPASEFQRDKANHRGRQYYCRDCSNASNKINRTSEIGRAKKNMRAREQYHKEPEKAAVRAKAAQKVRSGKIKKMICHCGNENVQAHHYAGYDEKHELSVVFLCRRHHKEAHAYLEQHAAHEKLALLALVDKNVIGQDESRNLVGMNIQYDLKRRNELRAKQREALKQEADKIRESM